MTTKCMPEHTRRSRVRGQQQVVVVEGGNPSCRDPNEEGQWRWSHSPAPPSSCPTVPFRRISQRRWDVSHVPLVGGVAEFAELPCPRSPGCIGVHVRKVPDVVNHHPALRKEDQDRQHHLLVTWDQDRQHHQQQKLYHRARCPGSSCSSRRCRGYSGLGRRWGSCP